MAGGYSEHKEVNLWADKREREMYDNFADLFAIIKTTEKLEKAYVRDVISAKEYEPACTKLIAQFRTLKTTLKDSVPDVERFMEAYKMDCPAALNRLLISGIPANVEHKSASSDSGTAVAVAECVQHYITAMDSLKLNMVAVDQVHPLLSDLMSSLSRVPQLSPDFEGKVKARDWIARLNKMGASDELNEQQARQLLFDLESSYNAFMNSLPKAS
jgi:ESCRT-I complex subunit VPS28